MPYSLASATACSDGILRVEAESARRTTDEAREGGTHQVPLSFLLSSPSLPASLVSPYWPLEPMAIHRISSVSSASVAVGKAARNRDEAETASVSKRLMMWLSQGGIEGVSEGSSTSRRWWNEQERREAPAVNAVSTMARERSIRTRLSRHVPHPAEEVKKLTQERPWGRGT